VIEGTSATIKSNTHNPTHNEDEVAVIDQVYAGGAAAENESDSDDELSSMFRIPRRPFQSVVSGQSGSESGNNDSGGGESGNSGRGSGGSENSGGGSNEVGYNTGSETRNHGSSGGESGNSERGSGESENSGGGRNEVGNNTGSETRNNGSSGGANRGVEEDHATHPVRKVPFPHIHSDEGRKIGTIS